jgi:hypothetical protein
MFNLRGTPLKTAVAAACDWLTAMFGSLDQLPCMSPHELRNFQNTTVTEDLRMQHLSGSSDGNVGQRKENGQT